MSVTARISAASLMALALSAGLMSPALADAALDTSFSGDGWLVQDATSSDAGSAVAVTESRIYTTLQPGTDEVLLIAYDATTGEPDDTFGGGDGVLPLDMFSITDMQVLGNGKLVLVGDRTASVPGRVIRVTEAGALDTTFSGDGIVPLPYEMVGVAIDSVGRAVVTGSRINELAPGTRDADFAVARIRATGVLDSNFSGDGKAVLDVNVSDTAYGVTVDAQDRPIVVGNASSGPFALSSKGVVARFKESGGIDKNFSGNGVATPTIESGHNEAIAVGSITKNRVVVALRSGTKFGAVRYTASGALDSDFSGDGKASGNHGGSVYGAEVAGGRTFVTGAGGAGFDQLMVGGVTAKGALNTAIGAGGRTSLDISAKQDFGEQLVVDANGKLVVTGISADGNNNDLLLARLAL